MFVRGIITVLVLSLAPLPCALCSEVAVAGTVSDAVTGAPIADAKITFSSFSGEKSVMSGDDGSYSVSLPDVTVGVDDAVPGIMQLSQNYPNPFNPSTVIDYELRAPAIISLELFSVTGQRVRTLYNGFAAAGLHSAVWDGCDDSGRKMSAAVYLYRLRAGNTSVTKKMLMIDGGSFGGGSVPVAGGDSRFAAKPAFLSYDVSVAKEGYATYHEAGFAPKESSLPTEKNFYLETEEQPVRSVVFTESTDDFPNPERGFYSHTVLNTLPDDDWLAAQKNENITILYTELNAEEYREKDFDQDFLDSMNAQFSRIRNAGLKVIFNVVYAHNIGEPDAAKEQVLRHIEQLRPLIEENWDVIYVAKTGFIGPWGEMHSSTNGLDTPENITEIMNKVLGVIPEDRMVMLRTPIMKVNAFDSEVMTEARAHDGSRLARVGFFNDCFLASDSDYGTYTSEKDRAGWIEYMANETKYTVFGGETCNMSYLAECENTLYEMNKLSMSWLNKGWHPAVRQNWEEKGCLPEISRRLGYRLVMREMKLSERIIPERMFHTSLMIENLGFAAPVNPRKAEIVLKNNESGQAVSFSLDTDPRTWYGGEMQTLVRRFKMPADLAPGTYTLLLRLADPCERLTDDPRYSIRLANTDIWEAESGMNILADDIVVSSPDE